MGLNYLRKIDTFGVPIDLCFEKKKVHKTPWGGFWTLIIFLFSLAMFTILGMEILLRQNPSIITIEQLERNPSFDGSYNDSSILDQRSTYKSSDIVFALGALDKNLQLIQNWSDSFEVTGQIVDQRDFKIVNQIQLSSFQSCNQIEFMQNSNNQKLFGQFDLSNMLCMQNDDILNYYLTGENGSQIYSFINIQITFKLPLDANLMQQLQYIGLFFTDQIMDVQNFSNTLTKYRKNILQKVDLSSQYKILLRNQYGQIMTDSGLMWTDYQKLNFFSFKSYSVSNNKATGNTLLEIQTETDPKLLIYQRKYMKVTELMATIGGFIKALLIAGFLLANPISKLSLKTELVNRLFNFEGIDEQDKEQIQGDIQNEEIKLSKGFSKQEMRNNKLNTNDNQIQLNFMRNNSRQFTQINTKNNLKDGPPVTYTESLNTTAVQPILTTNFSNLNNHPQIFPTIQKNTSQIKMNQLSLLKIARRKNQSMNDISANGLPSRKSFSPMHTQNQLSLQKDKVKLVRTMLKSFVSQHSMKPEDCMKASTMLGAHKKEDPDAVFKKLFKSNEKTLSMKLWDYIKYFLGLKNEVKNKQIKFSMRKVNERLDIVFIMKKLIEVDKLKMLFLNENQRKIFEYLPRPIVRLDPEQQQEECEKYTLNQAWARQMFFNDKNYISKASEAMLAYQQIIQKGKELDPLDQKLIEMLDESKKIYFQQDSPTYSPTGHMKRSHLSVINSINHSPKKKQDNNMFLNGLQNISPAESIELNENDIQEIKIQEIQNQYSNSPKKQMSYQNPDQLLHMYDNTRRFNRKNTQHFMKQRTLQFGDLNQDFENSTSNQVYKYPSHIQEKNKEFVHETSQQENRISQQESRTQQNNQQQVQNNSQQVTCHFITQQSNSPQQKQIKQISQQSIQKDIPNLFLINQNSLSNNKILERVPDLPNIEIVQDIEVPKNTVKTPKQKLFNQFFSNQNNFSSSVSSNSQSKSEGSSCDAEINNDYNNCELPADEKIQKHEIKDNHMQPSNYQQQNCFRMTINNFEQPTSDISQVTFMNGKKNFLESNHEYVKNLEKQKKKQSIDRKNSNLSLREYESSSKKFNLSMQKEDITGLAAFRENSLLNISLEPFTRAPLN
ncbi:transmembrane protein, putative (macronuclear) [Tetrahymena thermophila SB210]|uniref:Transmembrane protein, putative n=1 Tax=Tetrahymena thermophila (strain SB210) TaxID=312017 RepID=Q244Y0_TETTS|nr:transmembrane protein, putative [Tetrahymena thermophila SB210]EAS03357.2 transmembrane protein, putative [Tetrahymena thermophila SB210]|eukprot:XP_001023602.2 transmembrane protein, putative [Tetrahymena thermophila SB210]